MLIQIEETPNDSRNARRDQKLWNDSVRRTPSLGCTGCLDRVVLETGWTSSLRSWTGLEPSCSQELQLGIEACYCSKLPSMMTACEEDSRCRDCLLQLHRHFGELKLSTSRRESRFFIANDRRLELDCRRVTWR